MRRFFSALFVLAPLAVSSSASAHRGPEYRPAVVVARPSPVGQRVQVVWGGSLWDATVLAVRGDDFLVRYAGWSAMFDEWVDASRVSFPRPFVASVPVRPVEASWVYWGDDWRPGRVVEARDGWYRVHCDDGGRDADTWVEAGWVRHGARPGRGVRPPRWDGGHEHGGWGHGGGAYRPGHWDGDRPDHHDDRPRPSGHDGGARPGPASDPYAGSPGHPQHPDAPTPRPPSSAPSPTPAPPSQPPAQTPPHGARPDGGGQPGGGGHATPPSGGQGGHGGGHATPGSGGGGQGGQGNNGNNGNNGGHGGQGGGHAGHAGHGARPGADGASGSGEAGGAARPQR